jgi:hypothetical protein
MDSIDIQRLADKIVDKLETGLLSMPKEWHDHVMTGYMAMNLQIPKASSIGQYFTIEHYISNEGSLYIRIKDYDGTLIWERVFK